MYFILKGANFADSKLGKITVVEGQIGTGGTTIDPNAEYTLTVQPTPSDATVTLTATGYTQSGNSIKVKRGTQVTIKLEKTGYVSQTFTKTVYGDSTATYEIYAESVKTYTLTVNPNPANATVTLNGAETKSITVPEGQSVTWIVSASGYTTQTDVWLATKNDTLNITLVSDGSGSGGTTPSDPVTPPSTSTPTLVQGFVSGADVNNALATRVRIDGLVSGAFSVECNSGYLIRAIQECDSTTPSASDTNIVVADDKKTSYSGGSAGKYYAITFCKTNASSTISPTESIVKSFSGTIVAITSGTPDVDDTVAGTDVPYTLVQGAHVQKDTAIYQGPNRVTTPKAIKGKFTVTVNNGYAIRAVYEYTKESGDSNGVMVAETSETRTTFTSSNDNKYYGVTFTLVAPNAANNIAPTENIVASWKYV